MVILGVGSLLAIVLGFILAALIDREVAGKAIFRTLFLYPLAVSLIVTGIAWRWLFNPTMGIQNFLHTHGLTFINFNWLAAPETVMYGIILGVVWQSTGFYMALMLAGLKSINIEIWQAAKVDGVPFWRLYFEVIIPMMKLTFLTAILLLSIGVVKAYDIVVAMTNGGPGGNSYVPAYFTIQAYWVKRNLGFASSAATIMLLMTFLLFLPFVLFRRRAACVTQAAIEVPGLRAVQRARRKPIKPHRVAIFVFLLMAALFFCIPLYVIVITSLKTMDEIRLGQIFALPEVWSLAGWHYAWFEACSGNKLPGSQRRLLDLGLDSDPEPRPLDLAVDRDRLRDGDLERPVGEHAPLHHVHLRLRAVPGDHVPADQDHRDVARLRHDLGHRARACGAGNADPDLDLHQLFSRHPAGADLRRHDRLRQLLEDLLPDRAADVGQHPDRRPDPAGHRHLERLSGRRHLRPDLGRSR